jgi:hypothetical protein
VATSLRSAVSAAFGPIALLVCLSPRIAAAPQEPPKDLPVSLDRIRKELAKPSPARLDMPMPTPVAKFTSRVDQRVYVLTLHEWIDKEFRLTALQRQSADWAAGGGYVLASGSWGARLDPLFERLEKALERRKVRKIREQIARDLAEIEAARKKAGLPDKR